MARMKQDYARHGVTSVFATLASDTAEGWLRSIEAIENCGFDVDHTELDEEKCADALAKLILGR